MAVDTRCHRAVRPVAAVRRRLLLLAALLALGAHRHRWEADRDDSRARECRYYEREREGEGAPKQLKGWQMSYRPAWSCACGETKHGEWGPWGECE